MNLVDNMLPVHAKENRMLVSLMSKFWIAGNVGAQTCEPPSLSKHLSNFEQNFKKQKLTQYHAIM